MDTNKKLNMNEEPESYLLLSNSLADGYHNRKATKTFRLGEIVHHVEPFNNFLVLVECIDNSQRADKEYWIVSNRDLLPFDKSFEEYLLPVIPFLDRLTLVDNAKLCQKLKELAKDDIVFVSTKTISSNGHAQYDKPAIIKYKGPIPKIQTTGILFGLELLTPEDGDVNIECAGHSGLPGYFECAPLSGLIKSANEIIPCDFIKPSFNQEQDREENSRLPFKIANVVDTHRAKFKSMPQSSYFPKRSVDHSHHFDADRHIKTAPSPVSFVSKSTEDICCKGAPMPVHQRTVMDKTSSQPSRPDKLSISKKEEEYSRQSEYRNGYGSSHFNNELKYLSADQLFTKGNKSDLVAELPISHSSSNFTHTNKTTPMYKANGVATQMNSSDTIDGCKIRNSSKPVGVNNGLDKLYSTTYRDDYCAHKTSKVNNTSVTNNLNTPIYSLPLHSNDSDPDLNRSSNDHTTFHRDADFSSVSPELSEFEVGSVVEVDYCGKPRYGVIRWIGEVGDKRGKKPYVGIETETELEPETLASNGTFSGTQYFKCNPRRGIFVNFNKCKKDKRFQENSSSNDVISKTFGYADCPKIEGIIRPMIIHGRDLHKICGKPKGIQGHHNSCYLDATLFSMFTFTNVFDSLLYRPREPKDIPQYDEVRAVLRDEIVNPLRKNMFVRADKVMKLRTLLEKHSSVSGLTSEEKDPEEFLNSLVAQMLRAEPFLKLSSGQEAYYYQLFVEKDEKLEMPSVQNLFEQSFLASDIKLKEVPSCLIIQMPRFGKSFKMYPRILPSQLLDVTDVIEDSPRQCYCCGKLATFECKACLKEELETVSYCERCLDRAHSHPECQTRRHECKELPVPYLFDECPDTNIPRLYMELFAVVCIETSHYVSFVKCGDGPDAPWCFFDSMADRSGEQNGFNIPEVIAIPDLPNWLSEEGSRKLQKHKDRDLPEYAKRLFCDAYMCMYRSPDMQMYR